LQDEGLDKAELEELPVDEAPQLDESAALSRLEGTRGEDAFCPICSKVLTSPRVARCPHCGADIEAAREAIKLSEDIIHGIERALRQGDLEVAEEGLMQLDRVSHAKSWKATFLRARLCFLEKDFVKAIAMANGILEEVDVDKSLQEEIRAVLPEWQKELCRKLESQEHYNFALSRVRDGYIEEAREHLSKAIKLAPHLPANFQLLGKVCIKLRDYENGRYYLERALLLDEENRGTIELLTRLHDEEKQELRRRHRRSFWLTAAVITSAAILIGILLAVFFLIPPAPM
jgi:tetratricopeptide (TPR) repeat protein